MRTIAHRTLGAGTLALAAALALAGCGTPPWTAEAAAAEKGSTIEVETATEEPAPTEEAMPSEMPDETPAPGPRAEPTPQTEPTPRTEPTPQPPVVLDDLAAGSATRQHEAGASVLTIDYWSTLARDEWTTSAVKPLTLSVGAQSRAAVSLGALTVEVDRLTLDGWEAVPPEAVTQPFLAADGPNITSPATAGASVLVGDVGDDAHALRYTFVYTVTTTSAAVPVQSVATDSLVVTLADDDSPQR